MNRLTMTKSSPSTRQISPIDSLLGARLADARNTAGMSQETLGGHLGVTFQQVQKYEAGLNRISAAALIRAGAALRLAPAWFFEGLVPGEDAMLPPAPVTPDQREIIDNFRAIDDPEIRHGLRRLVRVLAEKSLRLRELHA